MSSGRHDLYVAPTSVMSAGQIQRRDLFDDDDDDDDDDDVIDRCPAAAAVTHTDVANVYSDAIERSSSDCHSAAGCTSNGSGCGCRHVLTMVLLTAVNLINYMDRFSVAGLF